MKIAHVSTFPETRCGIACYAADLIDSMPRLSHEKYALHYGVNMTRNTAGHADVKKREEPRKLAKQISVSDCSAVCLQHEFGIWGGTNGENIYYFMDQIRKPVISTLHTTMNRNEDNKSRMEILENLIRKSILTFVLSRYSKDTLCKNMTDIGSKIAVVPHGVPKIVYKPPAMGKKGTMTWKFCTIGFLKQKKGLEKVLVSIMELIKAGHNIKYVIAGSSQPQFAVQKLFPDELRNMIKDLGFSKNVKIVEKFLTRGEKINLIQESHAGIFAYQKQGQASSGTIPLVLAGGRPVICTPFEFALAKKEEIGDLIIVADDYSSEAIAGGILNIIEGEDKYIINAEKLSKKTETWLWKNVGKTYEEAFKLCKKLLTT